MKLDTEADRVLFVKSCVLTLIQKARVKLNPRNLYMVINLWEVAGSGRLSAYFGTS